MFVSFVVTDANDEFAVSFNWNDGAGFSTSAEDFYNDNRSFVSLAETKTTVYQLVLGEERWVRLVGSRG